jgi:hypothetical protein
MRDDGVADKTSRVARPEPEAAPQCSCVVTSAPLLGVRVGVGAFVDPSPKHALSACGNADEGFPFNIGELQRHCPYPHSIQTQWPPLSRTTLPGRLPVSERIGT